MMPASEEVAGPVTALFRAVSLFAALLLMVTWPLWSSTPASLAQIPWFSFLCGTSPWIDLIALTLAVMGLVVLGWGRGSLRFVRFGLFVFTAGLIVLILLDQHRLQPWVCQFLLFGILFLIAPDRFGIECWKVVTASIYLWSAVSKFDATFLIAHGQLLLEGMLEPCGIDVNFWSESARHSVAAMFPAGEFLIGTLLLLRPTQRLGFYASLVMHVLLLWTLGVGLHHEPAVLIWNAFFIVQNTLIFRPRPQTELLPNNNSLKPATISQAAAILFTALAALYPALELVDRCDHWPAWGVYSSRPAQVKVYIDSPAAAALTPELRQYCGKAAPLEDRLPFSLDAWSFARCQCPVYPQLRYRLGLALALLKGHIPDDALTVEIQFSPDRWSGRRKRLQLRGVKSVQQECRQFRFNTQRR